MIIIIIIRVKNVLRKDKKKILCIIKSKPSVGGILLDYSTTE